MKKIFFLSILCVAAFLVCCFCSCSSGNPEKHVYRLESPSEASPSTVASVVEKRLGALLREGTFSVKAQSDGDNTITVLLNKPSAAQREEVRKALEIATTALDGKSEILTGTTYALENVVLDSSFIKSGTAKKGKSDKTVFFYVDVTLYQTGWEIADSKLLKDAASWSGFFALNGEVLCGVRNKGNGNLQIYVSDWEQACRIATLLTAPLTATLTEVSTNG